MPLDGPREGLDHSRTVTVGRRAFPKLIVGLGNPGTVYEPTRHNLGKRAVTQLAQCLQAEPFRRDRLSSCYWTLWPGGSPRLAYLSAYMNLSGGPVQMLRRHLNVQPEEILVFHDELELPCGETKLCLGGSARGHNGLRSLISSVGTGNFLRLRIGIGRPECPSQVRHYVLERPTTSQASAIHSGLLNAIQLLIEWKGLAPPV